MHGFRTLYTKRGRRRYMDGMGFNNFAGFSAQTLLYNPQSLQCIQRSSNKRNNCRNIWWFLPCLFPSLLGGGHDLLALFFHSWFYSWKLYGSGNTTTPKNLASSAPPHPTIQLNARFQEELHFPLLGWIADLKENFFFRKSCCSAVWRRFWPVKEIQNKNTLVFLYFFIPGRISRQSGQCSRPTKEIYF